jgi:hypothetical protein
MRIRGVVAAAAALVVAGCGGGGTKTTVVTQTVTPETTASVPTTATTPPTTTTPTTPSASGSDTKPGTTLALGKTATVHYVPPSAPYGSNKPRYKLELTVTAIEKGSLNPDFNNVQLDAKDKRKTPYYVRLRLKNDGPGAIKDTDSPTFAFDAIDDRGEEQGDLTILGTFDKCDEKIAPKPFKPGSEYETCKIYLVGGNGSIVQMEWSGSSGDAYSDKPIVWKAG